MIKNVIKLWNIQHLVRMLILHMELYPDKIHVSTGADYVSFRNLLDSIIEIKLQKPGEIVVSAAKGSSRVVQLLVPLSWAERRLLRIAAKRIITMRRMQSIDLVIESLIPKLEK